MHQSKEGHTLGVVLVAHVREADCMLRGVAPLAHDHLAELLPNAQHGVSKA